MIEKLKRWLDGRCVGCGREKISSNHYLGDYYCLVCDAGMLSEQADDILAKPKNKNFLIRFGFK